MDGLNVVTVPAATGESIVWVSKPMGSLSRSFSAGNTSTVVSPYWTSLNVEVVGGGSLGTTLTYEVVMNFEITLNTSATGTGLEHAVPNDPPRSESLMAGAAALYDKVPAFVRKGVDDFTMDLKSKVIAEIKRKVPLLRAVELP